jgi:hypothetical protein
MERPFCGCPTDKLRFPNRKVVKRGTEIFVRSDKKNAKKLAVNVVSLVNTCIE